MNHRDNKEKNLPKEQQQNKMINHSNAPINYRSCLKHRSSQIEDNHEDIVRLSTYRVSFAHPNSNDGKIFVTSQSQNDLGEKKHRSAMFIKKAKELQLAEINYFKDHARDKEPIDE